MSHLRPLHRRGALFAAMTLAPLAFASTAGAAVNTSIEYQCKFPSVTGGVTIKLTGSEADFPGDQPLVPGKKLASQVTLPAGLSAIGGLASVEGTANLDVDLNVLLDGQEFPLPSLIDIQLAKKSASSGGTVLSGDAAIPVPDFEADITSIFVQGFRLNLVARNAADTPLQLQPIATDWDGNPWLDSDADPDTFDVLCRLEPASQNPTIKSIAAPVNKLPTAPGALVAKPANGSVGLTWPAATDPDGTIKSYRVYQDGVLVQTVTSTSATINGLTNGKQYSFQVSAVDNEDAEGPKGAATTATPANQLPSAPGTVVAKAASRAVTLTWPASIDADGSIKSYRVYQDGALVQTVTSTSASITGLTNGKQYAFQVAAVDNQDAEGAKSAPTNATPVNQAPTAPGNVTAKAGNRSLALTWPAATDTDGSVASYRVYQDGTLVQTVTSASASITGLTNGKQYAIQVAAVDNEGAEGAKSAVANATPVNALPTAPGTVVATTSLGAVSLSWPASSDSDGSVASYRVYQDGVLAQTVTGTSVSITGLTGGKQYAFQVSAVDNDGGEGAKSAITNATPKSPEPVLIKRSYSLAGTALIKTLSKGSLPITGGIDAELTPSTGGIEADLTLNPTAGRLTALGFLPVTAKIGFVPSGKTVGTLLDGQLNTTSKVRIKVQEVKLFGAIPLAGGNSCQTKSLSEIKLKNTQEFFDYLKGGPIAGTFAISDLNGCGLLNGLVSPLTAGGGNTLNLTLTPKASPAS